MNAVALVTGAAGGMGRVIVRRLAQDGFSVVAADRADDPLTKLEQQLKKEGLDIQTRVVDLAQEAAIAALLDGLPALSALVNSAGLFDERDFFKLTQEDFRRMYELNLIAAATLTQRAAARMSAGGKIVNIASRAYLGARHHAHYVASKAALVGYTRASAMELAPRGILVNAIAPGLIDTPMLRALTPERLAAQLALQPTGKAGTPEDIANAVSFLAAPGMSFITGQVLFVDGGKSLGGSGA
ncbi:MAG TPA: SDR family NAD(P)-dependent oxidoreductase [Castellaniella sp.]|jgi:3-oxoacyl-[acyl-carrier protein] reductase|nr:SDR family NAD(P)-dependent oxidoreductase [Castellaniella sp.]